MLIFCVYLIQEMKAHDHADSMGEGTGWQQRMKRRQKERRGIHGREKGKEHNHILL